jgi:hypothetical protein
MGLVLPLWGYPIPTILHLLYVHHLCYKTHVLLKIHPNHFSIKDMDENGAETDETKWCHVCFHIFMRKQKRIQKHQKQIWKRILSKIDMERIWCENGRKADDYWNQKTSWIMQQKSSKSSKSKKLFPKPIKITQSNGGVGVGIFDSSIW